MTNVHNFDELLKMAAPGRTSLNGLYVIDVDLSGIDIGTRELRYVKFKNCKLTYVDFQQATLHGCSFENCDMGEAYIYGCTFTGSTTFAFCDLTGTDFQPHQILGKNIKLVAPKGLNALLLARTTMLAEGNIIGYKKLWGNKIAKLQIPARAKRLSAQGRKCRASYAKVLSITGPYGEAHSDGQSQHDRSFWYKVGTTVKPKQKFCEDRWDECSSGIHFFLTEAEAKAY